MSSGTSTDLGVHMYEGREVYPNAPLVFVAAETRFTYASTLAREDVLNTLAKRLRDIGPIVKREKVQTLSFAIGTAPQTEEQDLFRLLDRRSTTSIAIQPDRIVVETTNYPEYPPFRAILDEVLRALDEMGDVTGVERVGLRYIDEVRVSDPISDVTDWSTWIDSRLVAATELRPEAAIASQGVVQFAVSDNQFLTFRYGAINGPSVVSSAGPLRRPKEHGSGSYFLLDIDSYWEARDETPPFSREFLMQTFDDLHSPTGTTFASVITERLKAEVLRSEADRD